MTAEEAIKGAFAIHHEARRLALEEAAQIADRMTDAATRKALGGNAVIAAGQIADAIRALAR